MTHPPRVVIVGGSLAGLMGAIALRHVGCDVHVCERSSRPLQDRGAGINLHHVLTGLLAQRANLLLEPLCCPVTHQQYLGPGNRILDSEPIALTFSSWNALFKELRQSLRRVSYRLNASCVGLSESDSQLVVDFADGRTETADLVVFADGAASRGRELWRRPQLRSTPVMSFGAGASLNET